MTDAAMTGLMTNPLPGYMPPGEHEGARRAPPRSATALIAPASAPAPGRCARAALALLLLAAATLPPAGAGDCAGPGGSGGEPAFCSGFETLASADGCRPAAPLRDPTRRMPETRPPRPALQQTLFDPTFGACLRLISDAPDGQRRVPTYSNLDAWSADGRRLLLSNGFVLNADTYTLFRERPEQLGWQRWGRAARWSPAEPDVIFSLYDNALRRYDVAAGTFSEIATFPEYATLMRDPSFETPSADGRYTGLVGYTAERRAEAFIYDLQQRRKSPIAPPFGAAADGEIPGWARVTPRGDYLLILWTSIPAVVAYDRAMRPLGVVAYGTGHADIVVDAGGTQWLIDAVYNDTFSDPAVNGKIVRKSRIPDGYQAWRRGDRDAVAVLLYVGDNNLHVSCRGPATDACILSSYTRRAIHGDKPLHNEILRLYLDSVDCPDGGDCPQRAARVDRLAHHYSAAIECGYWAQPHATVSRDGRYALFGSTWGESCDSIDAYLLRLD